MWIFNMLIIAILMGTMLVAFINKNYKLLLSSAIVAYAASPMFKIGATFAANPSYLYTLELVLFAGIGLYKKEFSIQKIHKIFLTLMLTTLLISGVAFLLFGNASLYYLRSFVGLLQVWAAILAISVIATKLKQEQDALFDTWIHGLFIVLIANAVMGISQLFFYDFGYALTVQLFAKAGWYGPLSVMEEIGYFARIHGSNYSPIVVGCISLCVCAMITGKCIQKGKISKKHLMIFLLSLTLGLLAYSKVAIFGIFVLLAMLFVCGIVIRKTIPLKDSLKRVLLFVLATACCFGVITAATWSTKIGGQTRWYFGMLIRPIGALGGRYGGILAGEEEGPVDGGEKEKPEGNLTDTWQVIKEHSIIGVGPAPIYDEFTGDSQLILVLHDGGILSFSIYLLFYFWLFIIFMIRKDFARAMLVVAIAVGCLALPVLEYSFAIPLIAYLLSAEERDYQNPIKLLKEQKTAKE